MTRTRRTIAAVIGGLALIVAGAFVATSLSYIHPESPDNPVAVRGCVIRFDELSATGKSVVPRIHANESHYCVGVTSVSADWSDDWTKGDLRIYNDGSADPIVSLVIDEDESFSQRGITCGGSGGGSLTRIRCYDRDGVKVPAYSLDLYGANMNLWVTWIMWDE